METDEDSVLGQTILLLRMVAPLGFVVLIAVSIGMMLVLFVSWLGEALLQVPIQDSVSAFIENGILLSIAFGLLGPILSGRVLPRSVRSQLKVEPLQTAHTPKIELASQLDLRVKEPEKPPPKVGIFHRFKERIEAEEKKKIRNTHQWEDRTEVASHETRPRPKELFPKPAEIERKPVIDLSAKIVSPSQVANKPPPHETAMITAVQNAKVTERPNDTTENIPGSPGEKVPAFVPPRRLEFRIEEMTFNCAFCSNSTSLPWEKVQENQKGRQQTVDCPHCHNQYQFNYGLAKGKMLSGKINTV